MFADGAIKMAPGFIGENMTHANQPIQFYQFGIGNNAEKIEKINSEVIVETPVSLTVNGEVWFSFMCTPVDLEALAVGFLFNEGLIESAAEITSTRVCPTNDNVDVWLHHSIQKPKDWSRTSGCTGGMTHLSADTDTAGIAPALKNGLLIPATEVCNLIGQLFEAQELYHRSGGVHTSALSEDSKILVMAEDIGRHNTLDKIAGRVLLESFTLHHPILLTTGRVSSEMLQKAARIGATLVISRTSPSSLSIDMAQKRGITLIGYAHRNRFNVYTHPERILNITSAISLEEIPDPQK